MLGLKKIKITKATQYLHECCICKHFKMWKPSPEYCTLKKVHVDPLAINEPCFVLRKGLAFYGPERG